MCGRAWPTFYDRKLHRARDLSSGDKRVCVEFELRRVLCRRCQTVRQETVKLLASNPFYTKRFAFYIGKRCRTSSISDVAKEFHLDWKTVKELEIEYMRHLLERAPRVRPRVIGIDEISVRKGHDYRIIVSDLELRRPIWFGGQDRSEKSMHMFYEALGPGKSSTIRLAVMDMWPPFETVAQERAPQAAILYDKFHVMRHLGEALDEVRRSEYRRVAKKDRRFIKGQRYTLLSHRENLTLSGRQSLDELLKANKRLNTAYILKESFGELWNYRRERWARRFFDTWKASLKWQRLPSYEKFARLIERHWDGIAAHCRSENKISLGFVEGLNTKIRVIQRRAYGLRDQEYLRLKILTAMLPDL